MRNLILNIILIISLLGCKNPPSTDRFTINLEISDTAVNEIIIGYQTNIGLTEITQHISKNPDNKIQFVFDSITDPLSVFLTIGKEYYQICAEPNSDLSISFTKDTTIFTGQGRTFADYYLKSMDYWTKTYANYAKRNPVLSGRPSGSKYFKVQDSITLDRIQFLDRFFSKPQSSSTKQFIKDEKTYLLYTDIFYKISGLTSINEFRFYQEKLKLSVDTFLTFTDKFDFNNPNLFNQTQYRRCFEWLPVKYIETNKLDILKDEEKAFDFVISLSNNETSKKYIEIFLLNNLIRQSNSGKDYSKNDFIKERIDRLSHNSTGIEKYYSILKTKFDDLVLNEKKSKELISLLSNPKYSESIQIQDYSSNENLELLRSIINKNPGKVLYVDFWAPWCRPCMDEMSNSKLLQKKYADENVAFIYLGFKCTEESWKTTIAQLRLTGIHYRLTDQQCDDYSKIFDFTGIPFYIIINKDGVVIDKNAPRPSDQVKLTTILDNLVK
jgi:thiol-disulfide isomerase/thioredoxin